MCAGRCSIASKILESGEEIISYLIIRRTEVLLFLLRNFGMLHMWPPVDKVFVPKKHSITVEATSYFLKSITPLYAISSIF
jgi:hypothetical protein